MFRSLMTLMAGGVLLAASSLTANAQDFPIRPVTVIVPYSPGGGTDLVGRKISDRLAKALGQPVIVENKPGAATMIAADFVKSAPADGYTILFASSTTLCIVPYAYKSARYSAADFTPVSGIIDYSFAIVARKDAPFDDMKGFVEYATSNPGKATFGTVGRGSSSHLLQAMMDNRLGIKTKDVPYPGGAGALKDILGGRLDVYADGILPIISYHKNKDVKVLAVTGGERASAIEDVPTFKEAGFDQLTTVYWFNMMVPKATPEPVVNRLNEAFKEALADKDIQDWMKASGYQTAYSTPADEQKKIDRDIASWSALVKEVGLSLD